MRAHVKQDYRDSKSGTAAGLRRFLQMTFSTKGLQVEELNARKQRGWRRVGRGMAQRYYHPGIAAKSGLDYFVGELGGGVSDGSSTAGPTAGGFTFPDDSSEEEETGSASCGIDGTEEAKRNGLELTKTEKEDLAAVIRQQDKMELVWAVKGFDHAHIRHLKKRGVKTYVNKKKEEVRVTEAYEVMRAHGAQYVGFFWEPLVSWYVLDITVMGAEKYEKARVYWKERSALFNPKATMNTPLVFDMDGPTKARLLHHVLRHCVTAALRHCGTVFHRATKHCGTVALRHCITVPLRPCVTDQCINVALQQGGCTGG